MKFRFFLSFFAILMIFSFSSCTKNKTSNISFEQIPQISIGEKWAVISSPYIAYKETPTSSANIIAHGRRGDIHQILGKKIEVSENLKEKTIWYKLPDGWIEESSIYIYNNQFQAQTSAKKIIDNK
jgi:hypothetical protein